MTLLMNSYSEMIYIWTLCIVSKYGLKCWVFIHDREKIIIVATTADFLHLWAHHTKWDYICVFISLCCIRLWGQPSLEWALYLIVFTIHSTQYIKSKNTFHLMDVFLLSKVIPLNFGRYDWKWIIVGCQCFCL